MTTWFVLSISPYRHQAYAPLLNKVSVEYKGDGVRTLLKDISDGTVELQEDTHHCFDTDDLVTCVRDSIDDPGGHDWYVFRDRKGQYFGWLPYGKGITVSYPTKGDLFYDIYTGSVLLAGVSRGFNGCCCVDAHRANPPYFKPDPLELLKQAQKLLQGQGKQNVSIVVNYKEVATVDKQIVINH